MKMTRRGFAATLAAPALLGQQRVTYAPPFEAPLEFRRSNVPLKVQPFPLKQVQLGQGIFHDAAEWNRGYMDRLAADRLVHNFRLNAGLASNATPFGGWEEPKGELRGHFTGHYLSACALNPAMKAKGDQLVADLAQCQKGLGGEYLSAFPLEFWDRLDARTKVWAPFYTIHKIMAGMYDMHTLAGNPQALEVLIGMATWADKWTASKSEAHMQEILQTEYGGMNEVLYNLAALTGDNKWASVGDRFTKKVFFNPLASRKDELQGLHVNTHIPQVIGAARRYEISGDMRFHDVADYFWYEVTGARAYVTGGTSNGEGWLTPPRQLAAELKRSTATAECCCAYNMLKLTRHLYSWTGDPRYFDYYERVLLNHRIGTILPDKGVTQYYLSLTPGTWKTFNTEDQSFWCCTGTGVEEYSKLQDSIYWHDDAGLFVNLFIASELDWPEKRMRVRQETKFPDSPATTLTFTMNAPTPMDLRLRVPAWLTSEPVVRVNGVALETSATPGSYLTIKRTWHNNDKVVMELPITMHTEAMPDDATMVAMMNGPLVLAADLGTEGLTPDMLVGSNVPRIKNVPAIEMPSLNSRKAVPLNSIFGSRYSVYWKAT
jgi:DUF1680 family protein